MKNKNNILKMVVTAILIALTIVLQAFATTFRIGQYSLPLSLVVIAVGAIIYGPLVGTLLGTAWGLFIFIADPSCASFMNFSVIGTIIAVIGRGAIVGLSTGWIYKGLSKLFKFKNGTYVAVVIAALLTPIINNLVFVTCEVLIFRDMPVKIYYLDEAKNYILDENGEKTYYTVKLIETNLLKTLFSVNLAISMLLSFIMTPVIVRVVEASRRILHLEEKTQVVEEENTNAESVYSQLD